jgi:hypothetical protein
MRFLRAISIFGLLCPLVVTAQKNAFEKQAERVLHKEILREAAWALLQEPVTVTASVCTRSTGSLHDFYSEADYSWPDSLNPGGPYVNRDGMTYPGIFSDHRYAMIRFSKVIGALASAYILTKDEKYALHAMRHLNAWFVNPETMMNPSLTFAQAIIGKVSGRGIGIIDTIHLVEVAQGLIVFEKYSRANKDVIIRSKKWFSDYVHWMTTHQFGLDEMNTKNNHGTCWTMQVASFAKLIGQDSLLQVCRDRYENILLPNQMAVDGSFPLETKRTKPYGYSIFNLDAMAMVCQILSDSRNDLWNFQTADGKSLKKGIEYLYPYIVDKSQWKLGKDVMYWNNWPVAQPFLIFGAIKFNNKDWFDTWKKLDHHPTVNEVVRNLPIRHPLIWLEQ